MNKRSYKLESQEIKKIMVFMTVMIAAYSVLSVVCAFAESRSTSGLALTLRMILILISALGIICTGIFMVRRFYGILFTDEGLIKFSYPVRNSEHLKDNVRLAVMWLGLQILVFIVCLGISEAVGKESVPLGPVGSYTGLVNLYKNNWMGEYMSAPGAKALAAFVIMAAAFAVIAVNVYISFIFTLTVSNRICGKYNILQKNGVILITGLAMFNIHLLVSWLLTRIEIMFNMGFLFTDKGFTVFGPDGAFVRDIEGPLVYILIYGVTAFIMYRICKNILDRKLDI